MPFIPHTKQDIEEMLNAIGADSISTLFDEIPDSLRHAPLDRVPDGLSEMQLNRLAIERASQDQGLLCFIGAGAYEHHIPAAVWDIAFRGEFYTAYTPYQPEASQGSLQLIYEYQTMMASLMGLDVSNASMYDGATALAEAILMAVRLHQKKTQAKILLPLHLHPFYRDTVKTIVSQQEIELCDIPFTHAGQVDIEALKQFDTTNVAALVIPQPNFFGILEDVDQLTNWAKQHQILSIGVVNPTAMALLKPPGEWGESGVDIACGEGQPLGIPLSSGGPYYGFLCCKKSHIRQMPGRIVGRTIDVEGKPGFVLTLQAREQHIRRAKATSNICTNQGLMVTASTIYMSLLGPEGLRQVALASHQRTQQLVAALQQINGVTVYFNTSLFFHECIVQLPISASFVLAQLAERGIQAGINVETYYPQLKNCLLVCATETKTVEDIQYFAQQLTDLLAQGKIACQA